MKRAASSASCSRLKPSSWRRKKGSTWWKFRRRPTRQSARSLTTASISIKPIKRPKSSRGSQLKEVKFRPATAEHDYQVRKNQIIRFLGEGHKVRAMIFHRGREMAHQEVGRAKMTRLLGEIGEHGQIETMPRMEGNVLVALLAPKKGAPAAKPSSQQAAQSA